MKYSATSKPGLGDPYWYEWSVGQMMILDMIDSESNISSVELQKNLSLGLDDVVVSYNDGSLLCIQVKHTRANKSLTFGDLVSSSEGKPSILKELADSWNDEKEKYTGVRTQIYTNRKAGCRESTTRTKDCKYKRPSLVVFMNSLRKQLVSVDSIDELQFDDYPEAWNEWCKQLDGIGNSSDKVEFLKNLSIESEKADLDEIKSNLLKRIKTLFHVKDEQADVILGRLDHALREWTTSNRIKTTITVEDVYDVLSINDNSIRFNHNLIPSEPFFSSREELITTIEEKLINEPEKVLFLSGLPGIGKTNIVSKLCNKRESLITFRYYAYEPIQPGKEYLPMDVSRRVESNYFWNELFDQLRKYLKGNLHHFNVPITNSFLSLEEQKGEYFRILEDVYHERKELIIIAIDGIDHAARAGNNETFLSTLPSPEFIPDGVKIIISGQPADAYTNYPSWLKRDNSRVLRLNITGISRDDIVSLVTSKIESDRSSEINAISDIVESYSKGNTLSAIFAVYEACMSSSVIDFEQRLKDRSLGGNIERYYQNIWENAVSELHKYGFLDYKLAGVFSLFNERVDETMLSEIFSNMDIPVVEWKNILKSLKPLLVEENNSYTILHNDVRVFFSGILNTDNDYVKEISRSVASYYLDSKSKTVSYYHDVVRFIEMAEEYEKVISVLTPDFAIEAYVYGVPIEDLNSMGYRALGRQLDLPILNWDNIQTLCLFFSTVSQIRNIKEETEQYFDFRERDDLHFCKYYECFVEPAENWNVELIRKVLTCIEDLFEEKKLDRAIATFKRWFDKLTITDIWNLLLDKGLLQKSRFENHLEMVNDGEKIADLLGKAVCWSGSFDMLEGESKDELYNDFLNRIYDSIFNEACVWSNIVQVEDIVSKCRFVSRSTVLSNIKLLLQKKDYLRISRIENALREKLLKSNEGFIIDCFLRMVSNSFNDDYDEACKRFSDTKEKITISGSLNMDEFQMYLMLATVAGFLTPIKNHDNVAYYIANMYIKKYSHSNQSYYSVLFNVCVCIGQWIYSKQYNTGFYLAEKKLNILLTRLFIYRWEPGVRDYRLHDLKHIILIALIDLANNAEDRHAQTIYCLLDELYKGYPLSEPVEAGIYYYRNRPEKIIEWSNACFGPEGKLWKETVAFKNEYIEKYIRCIKENNLTELVDINAMLHYAKWSIIGYTSDKEYSIYELLELYTRLVDKNPRYIQTYAPKVLDISMQSGELGDNRAYWSVNDRIYHDLFSTGIEEIKKIINSPEDSHRLLKEPTLLAKAIKGYIESKEAVEKTELLSLWIMLNGILDSRDNSNASIFKENVVALKKAAENNGYCISDIELMTYGSNGYNCIFEKQREDGFEPFTVKDVEDAVKKIENYLSSDDSGLYESNIVTCLETLCSNNDLYCKYLNMVSDYIFSQEIYGLKHQPLIQYVLKNLEIDDVAVAIATYLRNKINDTRFYVTEDLQEISKIMAYHLDEEYCKNCLEGAIAMQNSWITSAGHLPVFSKESNYENITNSVFYQVMSLEDGCSMCDILFKWLLVCVMCDDANQVLISLQSLYRIVDYNKQYIFQIESLWGLYHYRAKEWFLMIYELLLESEGENRNLLHDIVFSHLEDDDFNVAIFSFIIIKKYYPDEIVEVGKQKKAYFDNIPIQGTQKLLYVPNTNPWVTDLSFTYNCLRELENVFGETYDDIEMKVVNYDIKNNYPYSLISTDRHIQIKTVVYPLVKSFFDVLYKEWYYGRWGKDAILGIARIILSATEPYVLLQPADKWMEKPGIIIEGVDEFLKLSTEKQELEVFDCLKKGIKKDEMVLGGCLVDYSHSTELRCFMRTVFADGNHYDGNNEIAKNKRYLWQDMDSYYEETSSNIILINKGVESFIDTIIPCVLSKMIIDRRGWTLKYSDGIKIYNKDGKQIGRLERFFASNRDLYNRTISNIPMMQRWIVKKTEYEDICSEYGLLQKIDIIPEEAHQ